MTRMTRFEAAARGPPGRWLTVYHVTLAYGGPEEGGRWYESGERLEYVDVTGQDASTVAWALMDKYADLDDARGINPTHNTGKVVVVGLSRYPGDERTPTYHPQHS